MSEAKTRYPKAKLREMANNEPRILMDMITDDKLEDVDVTYAAEYLGHFGAQIRHHLEALEGSPSALVREGATMGMVSLTGVDPEDNPNIDAELSELCRLQLDAFQDALQAIADGSTAEYLEMMYAEKIDSDPWQRCIDSAKMALGKLYEDKQE